MSDLDGLINSKISLISQDDVKFDGTLYSINAEESSMVLKDGKGWIIYLIYHIIAILLF
jgi:hypothetical protein